MLTPIPPIAWQVTGNHWLSLPCVHPDDGSIHALGVLHAGARAAVEFAGAPNFVAGAGRALLRPTVRVDGQVIPIANARSTGWIPTFTWKSDKITVRGTLFTPFGRETDLPGAVYTLAIENGGLATHVTVEFSGDVGLRQQRIRSARSLDDRTLVWKSDDTVVASGSAVPTLLAMAVCMDDAATVAVDGTMFTLQREIEIAAETTTHVTCYLAVAPEGDGAVATARALRQRGWHTLLQRTREGLQALGQSTGHALVDRLVNDNLLFAYFYGTARAIDDARFYLLRSRAPWNAYGVTVRDWEALTWLIPAVQLADAALARELLLRSCELHGMLAGYAMHYVDGLPFEPGFSLEGLAAYALAVERYIRETGDEQIVEEPVVADTLYAVADELVRRRHKDTPLYATDVMPSGPIAALPFTLHGNAVVAYALEVLRRTLDEETAKTIEDPGAVRAAMMRHFTVERDSKSELATAIDLKGAVSRDDDPVGSILWLPLYDALDRQDSSYRRTVRSLSSTGAPIELVRQCARLVGPEGASTLAWLRRAPLDNGLAAALLDDTGRAVGNGGDAALAGLLAYSVWYAVHALGIAP